MSHMTMLDSFFAIEREDRARAVRELLANSTQSFDYSLLLSLAVLIAAVGIASLNIPLLIASMLIAPLLYPVLSLGLGIVLHDTRVIGLSARTLFWSSAGSVLLAFVAGFFLSEPDGGVRGEVLSLFTPSLGYLVVAVAAGIAVTYTLMRPHLSAHLPGVAVAVALLPPLAAAGVALSWGWWEVLWQALALFFLNVGGVVAASVTLFSLANMVQERPAAEATLAQVAEEATADTPPAGGGGDEDRVR